MAKSKKYEVKEGKISDLQFDDKNLNKHTQASMGVPQKRERVFFICQRKDLKMPDLKLSFNEKPIFFKEISIKATKSKDEYKQFTDLYLKYFNETKQGDAVGKYNSTAKRAKDNDVVDTITASSNYGFCHSTIQRRASKNEISLCGSYPLDYDFINIKNWHYLIGMSVPPVMTAQISHQIFIQWLSKLIKDT